MYAIRKRKEEKEKKSSITTELSDNVLDSHT
jgi:hypothetical protein